MFSKKFIASSAIYSIIGSMPLASGFFLLIFYTNYLTQSNYGALVLYISFTLFVQVAMNFGFDTYISVAYFETRKDPQLLKDKIGSIVGYLLLWGTALTAIFWILGDALFNLVFDGKDIYFFPYGLMSVVTAFFNSFFKTYTVLLVNKEMPMRFLWVNTANFVMTIAFSLAGLFMYPYTLIGPMWGRFLSGVGIFIIALIAFCRNYKINFRLGINLKKTLKFTSPVALFMMLMWIISNNYPFILKYYLTLDDVAIFGLALQFTALVEFMLNGLSTAITPQVYALIKDNDLKGSTPELNRFFSSLNVVSLLLIPATTFIIPILLPLIINNDYNSSYVFLAALNIGFATRALYYYFITPAYIFSRTKVLPIIYSITAAIQIVISILLIKYFGIWGAVWSNIAMKIIQDYMLYYATSKFFAFKFNLTKFIYMPLAVTAIIIVAEYHLSSLLNINLLHFTELCATALLVWAAYKDEMAPLLEKMQMLILKKKR